MDDMSVRKTRKMSPPSVSWQLRSWAQLVAPPIKNKVSALIARLIPGDNFSWDPDATREVADRRDYLVRKLKALRSPVKPG